MYCFLPLVCEVSRLSTDRILNDCMGYYEFIYLKIVKRSNPFHSCRK